METGNLSTIPKPMRIARQLLSAIGLCLMIGSACSSADTKSKQADAENRIDKNDTPQNGDVIFHTSTSRQSGFIQELTGSPLSHVGLIYVKDGQTLVLEAVQPVKITSLTKWINRGVDRKYILMRPKTPLSESELNKMYAYGLQQLGKPYDIRFQWTDKSMYCSELVYKIYRAAGIELCSVRQFKDYDLSSDQALNEVRKRYGLQNLNTDEPVVSPADLRNSRKLELITDTY